MLGKGYPRVIVSSIMEVSMSMSMRQVGYPTPICWGTDLSGTGEPTCLGSNADVRLVVADPDIAIRVRFVRKQK